MANYFDRDDERYRSRDPFRGNEYYDRERGQRFGPAYEGERGWEVGRDPGHFGTGPSDERSYSSRYLTGDEQGRGFAGGRDFGRYTPGYNRASVKYLNRNAATGGRTALQPIVLKMNHIRNGISREQTDRQTMVGISQTAGAELMVKKAWLVNAIGLTGPAMKSHPGLVMTLPSTADVWTKFVKANIAVAVQRVIGVRMNE